MKLVKHLEDETVYTFEYDNYYDLIKAIVDGDEDIRGLGEAKINNLITYDVSGDEIDEIDFAIVSTDTNEFGYISNKSGVTSEWDADNYRFSGSKTLSDKTVIFNLADGIDDWKVISAADLIDENEYVPYFFANQKDGTVGVVIIIDSSSVVNQDASLAFFVDYRTGVYEVNGDEEDVVYVNYYIDGELASEALAIYDDEYDYDRVTGDAFLYAKDDKGIVDTLVPVFSADNGEFATLAKGDLDDFMMYDENKKLDNEVYYGVLVKAASGKLTVAAKPDADDTVIYSDDFEYITVPETASVIQYKAYGSTDAKKMVACESILDLEVSDYVRVSGTNNVNLDDADLTYVFFRMNNGTVTEVLGVDFTK